MEKDGCLWRVIHSSLRKVSKTGWMNYPLVVSISSQANEEIGDSQLLISETQIKNPRLLPAELLTGGFILLLENL